MSESFSETAHVVIGDDDTEFASSLQRALSLEFCQSVEFSCRATPTSFLETVDKVQPSVCVIDLFFNSCEPNGHLLVKEVAKRVPYCRSLILTGSNEAGLGIAAMQAGAASFLTKPPNLPHLAALIRDGVATAGLLKRGNEAEEGVRSAIRAKLGGTSAAIAKVADEILFAARAPLRVLILGETGVGKGVCARLIHDSGNQSGQPFVRYQASGQAVDIITSDLFGHERGSFTGALTERRGLLAEAGKGTFFLDEVDALPAGVQVALLGPLDDQRYRRLGGNREHQFNCRIVTASNRSRAELEQGSPLRRDLYHRLAQRVIEIPPLRERREDIPSLAAALLQEIASEANLPCRAFDEDAISLLLEYSWPGNVRELVSVVRDSVYRASFARRSTISPKEVALSDNGRRPCGRLPCSLNEEVARYKRALALDAVQAAQGNRTLAAEMLGIDRKTLRRLLGDQGT